jgi:hypothetical protein
MEWSREGMMQSIPLILKELNGRHDWIRTSDLFRVKEAL